MTDTFTSILNLQISNNEQRFSQFIALKVNCRENQELAKNLQKCIIID